MSISFSGLASGLDTSSWVESLVKLKQAKITTLEEQKENVLLSKETLDGIKAFFSSFRSMIEKITDTKFGVASMDLFAQNLATSSNVSVLTGIATAEAEEATYNVLVDKLATETNALSNYNYMTTIVQTTTATNDSKLIHLGVKAGNIGVTVNGIERGVNITENDTIATFIEKLRDIGAEASYNEQTGVFSVNISDGAINDIDGTGIVDALHLRGVNEGYASNSLQTSTTDTVFSAATESTLMKDLGVSAGVVDIKANDTNYDVTISESTTLGDFINALRANDIDASIDTEGVFTIKDAEIVSQGTTNILDALGLEADIYDKSQSSGNLTNQTIITQTTTATSDTLLKDLGEGITVNNNSTVIVKNSNNEFTTITVGATSTVGDLLNAISNAGLSASINSDGIVEISGGTITGGTFDAVSALGLESSPYTAIVTGNPLTETIETKEKVTLNTRLVEDLGVKKGYLEVTDNDNNKKYLKIYSGQTFANLKSNLESYGLSCSLDESNGVLTITGGSFKALTDSEVASLVSSGKITESDATYRKGTDLLEHLYGAGTISTDHITVDSAYAKSQALNHTVTSTVGATLTTTLDKLGLTANGTAIFDVNGTKNTINVSKTMTMQGLIDALNAKGISANWDNDTSKLTIENAAISGGTSNLSSVLDLSETVYGKYTTSSALYSTTTDTIEATRETTLKDFGIANSQTAAQRTVDLYNSEGAKVGSITVTEDTTIGSLVDFINSKDGVSASIENGVLKINDGYISNAALEASMGLEKSTGSSYVLGSVVTTTVLSTVTGESKLGDIIAAMGTGSNVSGGYNLTFDGKSISVDANSSLNDIINEIYAKGGSASLDSTGRLTVTGGTLTGSVADALGITSTTNIASISSSGKAFTTSKEVYADRDTALSELGVAANSTFTIKNASGGTVKTVTVAANTTIGGFFDTLKANGIDGIISDGVITLQSSVGNYIEGTVADTLGILKRTTTTIVNTTQNSTASVTHSQTVIADLTSTLGEVGGVLSTGTNNILIYNNSQQCIGTISNLTTTSTIGDMFNSLKSYGIKGTISNGVISLNSTNGNYVDGTIMTRLGISSELLNSDVSTIAMSVTSGSPLTTSILAYATADTMMSELVNLTNGKATVTVQYGTTNVSTVTVTTSTTLQDFFDSLSSYATFSIDDGVISYEAPFLADRCVTFAGTVIDDLNLVLTDLKGVGTTSTSSDIINYTTTRVIQGTDKISDVVSMELGAVPTGRVNANGSIAGGTIVGIYTEADLKNMTKNTDGYDGYTFVLVNDITLNDTNWQGIGNAGIGFLGKFDGNGHSIKMNISTSGQTYTGLFAKLDGGSVENLSVYGTINVETSSTHRNYVGGIVGYMNGTINRCTSSLHFELHGSGLAVAGGFVGVVPLNEGVASIMNSTTIGMTYKNETGYKSAGGLCGSIVGSTTTGSITASSSTIDIRNNEIYNSPDIYAIGLYDGTPLSSNAYIGSNHWNCADMQASYDARLSTNNGYRPTSYYNINDDTNDNDFINVYDKSFKQIGTISFNEDTTFDDLIVQLGTYGINAAISNGVLTLNSDDGNFILGSTAARLGIGAHPTNDGSALGQVSSGTVMTSVTTIATMGSAVGDFLTTSSQRTVYIENKSRNRIGTITLAATDTFSDLATALKTQYGIDMTLSGGRMEVSSDDGHVLTGTLATKLGLTLGYNEVEITSSNQGLQVSKTIITATTSGGSPVNYIINGKISSSGLFGGDTIAISSTQDLQNLANWVNDGINMAGKTFVLTSDIDLSGVNFTPIGKTGATFNGTFIGCGHTISNMSITITTTGTTDVGLFGGISQATIKDLKIENPYMSYSIPTDGSVAYFGGLVGYSYNSTIEGVSVTGSKFEIKELSDQSSGVHIGGIVGYDGGSTTITNCLTSVSVLSSSTRITQVGNIVIGGIAGRLSGGAKVDLCEASLNFAGDCGFIGGIVGDAYIANGTSNKTIIISNTSARNNFSLGSAATAGGCTAIGGIVGRTLSGTIGNPVIYVTTNFVDNRSQREATYFPSNAYGKFVGKSSTNYLTLENNCALYNSPVDESTPNVGPSGLSAVGSNNISTNLKGTAKQHLESAAPGIWTGGSGGPYILRKYTTYEQTLYGKEYYNNISSTIARTQDSVVVTADSYLEDIHYITDGNNSVAAEMTVVGNDGAEHLIKLSSLSKVSDLINKLAEYGVNMSVENGLFKISESSTGYIKSMNGYAKQALKLSAGDGISYLSEGAACSNSSIFNIQEANALYSNTKLSDLGIDGNVIVNYIKTVNGSIQNGTNDTLTFKSDNTIGDIIGALNAVGIKASVVNGKFSLGEENSDIFVSDMSVPLKNALKLTVGFVNSSGKGTINATIVVKSDQKQVTNNTDLSLTNKIKDIAGSSTILTSTTQNITVVQNGTERVVSVSSEDTFEELFSKLQRYGINGYVNNGKVEFDCNNGAYIKGMSNGLDKLLGLTLGENKSYSIKTENTYGNTDSNNLSFVNSSAKLSGDTVLNKIASYTAGNNKLAIHKADGTLVTITVDGTGTLDDFFNQISAHGLTGSVDSTGKVTIMGLGDTYLEAVSGGSNILTALKLSSVAKQSNVSTSNTALNVLKYNQTVAATSGTTLQNLEDALGNALTFDASGKASLILEKTNKSGDTSTVTLEFTKTSTLDDVIDELAKHGITASVDARGKFSVSTNSLQDFDISGTLGSFLMGSYTKDYDITSIVNTSNSLSEKKVIKMNDGTKLSDLGITSGKILVTQNGISTTVNIDTTTLETVGDFRDFLSYYGFTTNIYNQGRISVSGEGESSLASISGGSNILTKLGLTNWTMNDVSQSSDYLVHDEIKTDVAKMSNKLSELTDASGTNLGITSGQIAVYHNGTRNILNIDSDETLDSLANKLSQYGITVNIASDGKLYFNGSNNSYLSKDGVAAASLSNILDKIGVAGAWTTSGTSTSKKLEYQEQTVEKIDLNTKLSELKDASGNSLGITDGAFYVYSNGVRNTETIDTNMSVGDFISLMGAYGINAEIMSDGSISLKANSNSYLETSSLSGNNSNIVSKLFNNYEFKKSYASDKLEITKSETNAITRDTKLSDINEGTYQAGYITVVKDGVNTNIEFSANDTIGSFIDKLALYGFNATINGNGQLVMNSTGNSELKNYTGAGASNVLDILGVNEANWIKTNKYQGDELNVVKKSTTNVAATRDTLMSELGVTAGEYYIYNNGVKYTAMISSDETLGSFMDTLKSFGLETSIVENGGASVLSVVGKGDSYVSKSSSVTNASNVVEKLFSSGVSTSYEYNGLQQTSEIVTTYSAATEDTLLSYFDNGVLKAEGDLSVSVNGIENTIKITADETFGSLIDKLKAVGVEATMTNGQLMIQSGYDSFTINTSGTTSNLQATINLMYDNDLGGYVASSDTVLATTTTIEEKTLSVSNYADSSTKLGQLNISNGALTVYRNGQKATIQINSDETFGDLQSRLSNAFSDLDLKFEDGCLTIYSKNGSNVEVGATTDTTNFSAITGIIKNEDGTVKSARELYRVNGDSVVTDTGLFRSDNVQEGTFIIGNETFTIDDKTTLSDIISQINSNEKANATAYWDNIKGRLVIKSRTTGAAYVNIEAGTSNFTDVMGFTTSEWNADGSLKSTRMNINNQEIGQNARISINGTNYTSTSNTITSDVSRIKGLTIKLNGLTEGSAVTLTVEKDKETLANAVSDVIDSYNELMKNVDEAISKDGKLNRETTLKMIRNNLRNIMTSSDAGTTVYRNLSAIGISTSTASANNISTTNESVINLAFDKEKFIEAYEADSAAVKALLTGSENNKGVFTKVEELMESTLQSVSGYFASAENSFTKQAETIEHKIVNGTKQIERYRARLETRFSSMDMLIANMQQQYSSFLTT